MSLPLSSEQIRRANAELVTISEEYTLVRNNGDLRLDGKFTLAELENIVAAMQRYVKAP